MPDEVQKSQGNQPEQAERKGGESPAEPVGEVSRNQILAQAMQFFSGPLPPPVILEQYERLVPGAAKDMHELALAKARHHMEMDRTAMGAQTQDLQAERAQFKRGQDRAFMLALVLIGCGTACILTGHDTAGAGIIVGTLVALVLAFIWGRRPGGSPEGPPEDSAQSNPPQS